MRLIPLEVSPLIHLIRPPYSTDSICPPINLLALAAYVEPYHQVSISDFVISYVRKELTMDAAGMEEAARQILQHDAKVLAFTSMCSSYAAALRMAEACKRLDPSRFILFGGPHAGFVARETLEAFDFVDAIVLGEGEETLLDLLNAMRDNTPFHSIPSLVFRDGEEIVETPRRKVLDDLGELPFPAFHLIQNVDQYYEPGVDRFIEIEAGRGCPFNCKFCSTSVFFSRRYRLKTPKQIVDEMVWLRQNWNITSFGLIHDNLTVRKDMVRELCDYIHATGDTFQWYCSSRTDTIDREMMEFMKDAGCQGIFFGVETGSQSMQKTVGKRLKLDRSRETFLHLAEVGIDATASFIIGFPDETLDDLEETLSMALEVRMYGTRDVQLHPITALPGTEILSEHEDRLVFHEHVLTFHDITSVIEISEVEMEWIRNHRRAFSNFYALPPLHYPMELVYQIRGCYFHLMHERGYTLYSLQKASGMKHVEIVEQLIQHLPAAYRDWTPERLTDALETYVAAFPGEVGAFVRDVLLYEQTMRKTAEFTDGANGWIRYKGAMPEVYAADNRDVALKPLQVLELSYDVPNLMKQMLVDPTLTREQRDYHLAIVFEWEARNVRTMEVDPLTAEIMQRVQEGASLEGCIQDLSEEHPFLSSDEERVSWRDEVMTHLDAANLLVHPASSSHQFVEGL